LLRTHAADALSVHLELERGAPFCANPACALHVRLLDARAGENRSRTH